VNIDHFNETLWVLAEEDRNRLHNDKKILQSKLFEEDLEEFLMLPEKRFNCARYEELKADKYGIVNVDKKKYYTYTRLEKQKERVYITYYEINILNAYKDVLL